MLETADFSLSLDTTNDLSFAKKVRFVLQGYIVRLINNAYVKTIYRKKRIFDRMYIFKQNSFYQNNKINLNDLGNPSEKQFIEKVNSFINRYITLLINNLQSVFNHPNSQQNIPKVYL